MNVKLVKTGGISAAFEALQAARKAGLKTMIGCMIESSLLITAGAHLAELVDYLDIDGNLLITNDPCLGATAERGVISFAKTPAKTGLPACEWRRGDPRRILGIALRPPETRRNGNDRARAKQVSQVSRAALLCLWRRRRTSRRAPAAL